MTSLPPLQLPPGEGGLIYFVRLFGRVLKGGLQDLETLPQVTFSHTFGTGDTTLFRCTRKLLSKKRFSFLRVILCVVKAVHCFLTFDTLITLVVRRCASWDSLVANNYMAGRTLCHPISTTVWCRYNLPLGARHDRIKGVWVRTVSPLSGHRFCQLTWLPDRKALKTGMISIILTYLRALHTVSRETEAQLCIAALRSQTCLKASIGGWLLLFQYKGYNDIQTWSKSSV